MYELMITLWTIGIVLGILSMPIIVIGTCKYGWFDRKPLDMAMALTTIPLMLVMWFAILPIFIVMGVVYLICKGLIALCPNR